MLEYYLLMFLDGCRRQIFMIFALFSLILVYKTTLGTVGVYGTDATHFNQPYDVAFDAAGNAYIADSYNQRVQIFDITTRGTDPSKIARYCSSRSRNASCADLRSVISRMKARMRSRPCPGCNSLIEPIRPLQVRSRSPGRRGHGPALCHERLRARKAGRLG